MRKECIIVYKIYMDNLLLPVAPAKMILKVSNANKTMELISGGEINFLRTQGLSQLSFQFLIPQVNYPFAEYPEGFKTADSYINKLKELKAAKKTFNFNIYRTMPGGKVLFEDGFTVSLEEYTLTEDALNGTDITADVSLKVYPQQKALGYQTISKGESGSAIKIKTARASDKVTATTYTVKKGDTLWAICKAQLGDGSKYKAVAAENGIANPNRIYPGQIIKLEV